MAETIHPNSAVAARKDLPEGAFTEYFNDRISQLRDLESAQSRLDRIVEKIYGPSPRETYGKGDQESGTPGLLEQHKAVHIETARVIEQIHSWIAQIEEAI